MFFTIVRVDIGFKPMVLKTNQKLSDKIQLFTPSYFIFFPNIVLP